MFRESYTANKEIINNSLELITPVLGNSVQTKRHKRRVKHLVF